MVHRLRLALRSILALIKDVLLAFRFDLFRAIGRFLSRLTGELRSLFCSSDPLHVINRAECIPIRHPAYKKPDPLIYDQYYLMALGLAVSWQNPDIELLLNGVPVASPDQLHPATDYTVRARIWNGSTSGVVSGMPVSFSYLTFGVSTESHAIGETAVDLGVKGSSECPTFAEMAWTTPATPGHYCIQVAFEWPDDANPLNNLGQENTQVVKAQSPAQVSFALRNADTRRKEFGFKADTYAILPPPPCSEAPRAAPQSRAMQRRVSASTIARNSSAANPLPPGWSLSFSPAKPVLAAGEQVDILATITPADSFHGTQSLNIHTFSGKTLAGGVTILVERD
jgi:hypothetical protein